MKQTFENLIFPPPVFDHFGGKILDIKEKRQCTCSFPLKQTYENPMGIILGGVYGIFFDLTIGPFSFYITGRSCTSLDLNVDFLKAMSHHDKNIIVTSKLITQSKSFLLFHAEAFKEDNTLVATAKSRMMILSKERMAR